MKRDRNVPADDSEAQMEGEMAALTRAQDARIECWDAFAAGRCSLDEATVAARASGQTDEEIARASELFAPVDDAMLASIIAAVGRTDDANVVRPDPGRWQRPAIAAALAVLAAGLVLWVNRGPATVEPVPVAGPMVAHELSIRGVAEVRGDATGPRSGVPSVPAGATLPLLLRPATRHDVAPHVWACAVQGDQRIALPTEVVPGKPGRAIEASVVLPDSVKAGTWEMLAFVSSTAAPNDACATEAAAHVAVAKSGFVVR